MGKLRKRKGVYHADYQDRNGRRQRHTLKTGDSQVAKARLRVAELGETGDAEDAPKPLGHAINQMIALKREQSAIFYKNKSLHLFRLLGADLDINTLTRAVVAGYIAQRLDEKAGRQTIHGELVALRQALKEAKARQEYRGSLDVVPPWKVDYQPRTRWLTPAEFKKLFLALAPQNRTWIMLEVYTSSNLSETKRMGWEHIRFAEDVVVVPGKKQTSRQRMVPLHPELRAWLEGQDPEAPLTAPWSVAKGLREACDRAKIPRASTNDLRRTFGSWLKQAGVDSLHVAQLMGHKSTTMVDRVYGQLTRASYAAAMDRMPGALGLSSKKLRHTGVTRHGKPARSKGKNET